MTIVLSYFVFLAKLKLTHVPGAAVLQHMILEHVGAKYDDIVVKDTCRELKNHQLQNRFRSARKVLDSFSIGLSYLKYIESCPI